MRRNSAFAVWTMFTIVAVAVAIRVVADEPEPTHQLTIYSGILRAVDLEARIITVDGSAVPQKFMVPTDAEIIVKDKPRGTLGDLKAQRRNPGGVLRRWEMFTWRTEFPFLVSRSRNSAIQPEIVDLLHRGQEKQSVENIDKRPLKQKE